MARFPDSRITAARWSSQAFIGHGLQAVTNLNPVTSGNAPLTAYSGGTVWASHPLRMAAGVNVRLSTHADVTYVVPGIAGQWEYIPETLNKLPQVYLFT